MAWIIKTFGWFYQHWGSMSQLIVGLVAFLLAMLPSTVLKLEKKPQYKIGIPLFVGLIAITGYIVSEQGESELKHQLQTMYQQVRLVATKDDIANLTAHIDTGFKSVVDAITGICKPSKQPHAPEQAAPLLPLPVPPNTTITQTRALSTDPQFRFGLQVTIQSTQSVQASFAIECTGEVGQVTAFMVGQSAYVGRRFGRGENRNVATVHFDYPPLSPQTPLVVTILSEEDIRVKAVTTY
ncbi:MAG: hypothetical protein ACHP78_14595 [Terriglobales bacterium]